VRAVSLQFKILRRRIDRNHGGAVKILTVSPTELPTIWNPSVLNRELKNIYEILPQSSTGTPMEWYPSVFYKELQNNYEILPLSPTAIPTD
jgi:hypothetical protein